MKRSLFFLLLALASCGRERLAVQSEYLLPGRYASVWVGTPDPHKAFPDVGQRLIMQWKLKREFASYQNVFLRMRLRFRNHEVLDLDYPLGCPVGRIIYKIMNDDYTHTKGIGAYTVEIIGDGVPLACIQHHLWKELVFLNVGGEDLDALFRDPDDFPDEFDYQPDFDEGESFYRI